MVEEAKGRASEEGAKIIAAAGRSRAGVGQGPRGAARAGRRPGRQGRRADPAPRGQRRRARRAAGPPEGGALTWPSSPPSPAPTPRPVQGRRRRDAAGAEGADGAGRGGRRRRSCASSPTTPRWRRIQVFDLIAGVALSKGCARPKVGNLLRAVIENGRLAALPEIAAQFQALVNASSGVSDATDLQRLPDRRRALADVVASLEKRFARKLKAVVEVVPELIGGIRVVVGDEVLDTSVKARLEQMKVALTPDEPRWRLPPLTFRRTHEPQSRRNFRADQEPHRGPWRVGRHQEPGHRGVRHRRHRARARPVGRDGRRNARVPAPPPAASRPTAWR
jgi:F-type H+-transporting ATPase subunit delta